MPNKVASYSGSVSTGSEGEGSVTGAPLSSSKPSGGKRRASRAGTRSVSTLSAAQLARKRANDRDAQRAIRQRTKERVEDLERQVAELSAVKSEDAILQRNIQLEAEIRHLRARLLDTPSHTPPASQWAPSPVYYGDSPMSAAPMSVPSSDPICMPDLSDHGLHGNDDVARNQAGSWGTHNHAFDAMLRNGPPDMDPRGDAQIHRSWLIPNNPYDSPPNVDYGFDQRYPPVTSFPSSGVDHPFASPVMDRHAMQPWEIPIRFLPSSHPNDELLASVIEDQLRHVIGGTYGFEHANPRPLMFVGKTGADPISSALAEILHATPIPDLAEKVGALFLLHKILRWHICPSRETYEGIPEWFRPRPLQIMHLLPFWISAIVFPQMRDKLISEPETYVTEEFENMFLLSMSINWPYSDLDLVAMDNGEMCISPLLEKHAGRLENWTLGPPFTLRYPELAHICNFSDRSPAPGMKPTMGY